MKQPLRYWLGILLLATLPILAIDMAEHYVNWKKEVREEIIILVQQTYDFTREQKAVILDKVFERNERLSFLIYAKAFLSFVFLASGLLLLWIGYKTTPVRLGKSVLITVSMACLLLLLKYVWVTQQGSNQQINILSLEGRQTSLQNIIQHTFKNKVVYVDFWGTTCGPCLVEFRNFIEPLKERYRENKQVQFLYISGGSKYLWKRQIEKYGLDGYHLFLDDEQYNTLFRHAIGNDTASIIIPRYMIIDQQGKIVVNKAKRPSDKDSLFAQIDQYLLSSKIDTE